MQGNDGTASLTEAIDQQMHLHSSTDVTTADALYAMH